MASAISIGQTGLVASSKQMDVIANNLANSSTVGFKASSTLFASMMGQGLSSSGTLSVGQGVGVVSLPTQFSQGSFENTGNVTDMAIDGEGFFIVNDPSSTPLYTRAGSFHIDSDSNLVDIKGYNVQGYATGSAVQSDIVLQKNIDATTTSEISFGANLDESTAAGGTFEVSQNVYDSMGGSHTLATIFTKQATAVVAVEETQSVTITNNATATGNTSFLGVDTAVTIADTPTTVAGLIVANKANILAGAEAIAAGITDLADAGGGVITVTFTGGTAVVPGSGDVAALAASPVSNGSTFSAGAEVIKGVQGTGAVAVAPGTWAVTATFDGVAAVVSVPSVIFDGTGTLTTPAADATITINAGAALASGATIGTAGTLSWNITSDATRTLTGYTSESSVRSLYADGYASGELRRLSVDNKGIISGVYTNGQTLELCQLALANFQDQTGLASSGNYFLETSASGQPAANRAGTAGLGNVQGNALESSNTDVSKEFISMITAQRAYQANAKIITTSDQMLSILMNIKQ